MTWSILYSRRALRFLRDQHIDEKDIFVLLRAAIKKFQRESDDSLDIKKPKGAWAGFYRIRRGKTRIIVQFDFDELTVFVEVIDWRDSVYR